MNCRNIGQPDTGQSRQKVYNKYPCVCVRECVCAACVCTGTLYACICSVFVYICSAFFYSLLYRILSV